jgi:hypothetical protein
MINTYKILVGAPEGAVQFGRVRRRSEDNILIATEPIK